MYSVELRQTGPVHVAALHHSGDYQNVGGTFERLFAMAAGRGLLGPKTRCFGLYYDDPEATPAESLRSEACLEAPGAFSGDGDLHAMEIAGGRHAVVLHVGPYAELHKAYTFLFREWLPKSGEEAADRPCVEEYLNNPREVGPADLKTELWLPIRDR
jgi:AraC family transcriptional regulator